MNQNSTRSIGEHYRVNFVKKCCVDVGLIAALIALTLITHFYTKAYERGFFCNDTSIRYPLHEETVSSISLYLLALGFPLILLGLGEILFASEDDYEEDVDHFVWKWQVPKSFVRTYDVLVSFSFGFMVCVLIVIISQTTLGKMRPNFLSVCQPFNTGCAGGVKIGTVYDQSYVNGTSFKCKGNEEDVEYARLSFPSKHATLCFYSMVYLSVYLQKKVHWEYLSVFTNCLQVMFVFIAWIVSISRITDYYNRLEDVLAGIVIGSLVAWFNIRAVFNFFKSGVRMTKENRQSRL